MAKEKITMATFKKAAKNSGGILAAIAKKAGVCRQTVATFVNKYPKAEEILYQEKELILDISETSLFKQSQEGEQWAVKFLLTTQGKSRGYVPSSSIDLTSQGEKISFIDQRLKEINEDTD